MRTTGNYRDTERRRRLYFKDDNYRRGMFYTNTPLEEEFCKLLVNLDLKEKGDTLQPRSGYSKQFGKKEYYKSIDTEDNRLCLIGTYDMSRKEGEEYIVDRMSLVWNTTSHTKNPVVGIRDSHAEPIEKFITDVEMKSTNFLINRVSFPEGTTMHDMPISVKFPPVPAITSFRNNTYALGDNLKKILVIQNEDNTEKLQISDVEPLEVTPREAINYGYNMLLTDPYKFNNKKNTIGKVILEGILPYDKDGEKLMMSSRVGGELLFKAVYTYPEGDVGKKYKSQWAIQDIDSDAAPTVLQKLEDSPEVTAGESIELKVSPPYKRFSIILEIYLEDEDKPKTAMVLPAYTLIDDDKSQIAAPKNYPLSTAEHLDTWDTRLLIYGVENAENILFTSEAANPTYFPYPNGVTIFSEQIMKCVQHMDNLLVFTKTRLYQLVYDPEKKGFTRTVIQDGLNNEPQDMLSIQAVKNMLYFKSGDYYYMVVPKEIDLKTRLPQLKLAPISTPVTNLLKNMDASIRSTLDIVYDITNTFRSEINDLDLELCDYYNYLDGEVVRNVYQIKLSSKFKTLFVDFVLNYDTMLRTWTVYTKESFGEGQRLMPIVTGASGVIEFIGSGISENTHHYRLLHKSSKKLSDSEIIPKQKVLFQNVQCLDTGYRKQDAELQKRFREIQFKINNISQDKLRFFTQFYVDDEERKQLFQHKIKHITDTSDPNYGTIYVSKEYADPAFVTDRFLEGNTKLDYWELDNSMFPTIVVHKIRMKVSGKGYAGRFLLISNTDNPYHILSVNWVYRTMLAR